MGILDVIDGVFVGLAFGQIKIKIEVLIRFAQGIEKAASVIANLAAQFAQGNEFSGARGHRRLLAISVEHGKLYQRYLQFFGVKPKGGERPLDPRNIAVVISTPDIDDLVKPALVLVQVVGNIRSKIGVETVFALHDAIFFIAEGRGLEPLGAILHIEVPVFFEEIDGARHQASVEERLLRKPDIEADAKRLEVVPAIRQLLGQRVLMHIRPIRTQQRLGTDNQRVEMGLALILRLVVAAVGIRQAGQPALDSLGRAKVFAAVRCGHLTSHVAHIRPLVGIGRKGDDDAIQFQIAQPRRQGQDVHLPAGIIDVKLARHFPAGKRQQVGQRSTVGGTAAMPDMQRPGRVGGNEFNLNFLPPAQNKAAKISAQSQHPGDGCRLGSGIKGEIDEPGASDFGLAHQRRDRELIDQLAGDIEWILFQNTRQLHGQIGGKIAVRRIPRPFKQDGRGAGCGRNTGQRLLNQRHELGFDILGHKHPAVSSKGGLYGIRRKAYPPRLFSVK
ncbi:MAG: hypothetical protein BWY57_00381 [Betaproteobacteria bacterium ADurb.Bin341]|nr:MAG: hypothetical protein BWY57_00381 [Betaproteobacteria bacterium ADurb.Bin341]